MTYQFTFDQRHKYDSLDRGITIDATLQRGDNYITCEAKVDTGSQYCIFSREVGEFLGLEIETGLSARVGSVAGHITVYGPEVTLKTLGQVFHAVIYFAEIRNLPRNLLGREGWLRLLRIAIIDYDEEIYLSPYDEQT